MKKKGLGNGVNIQWVGFARHRVFGTSNFPLKMVNFTPIVVKMKYFW